MGDFLELDLLSRGSILVEDKIKKFIGKPYDWDTFNCYTLIIDWYKDLGYFVPDYKVESNWNHNGKNYFLDEYHKLWKGVDLKDIEENDVVLFKIRSPVPNHVGIYIGNNRFIQCVGKSGTVVSDLNLYSKYVHGCYRLKEKIECLSK
jgi:cell wall-associated NlpC family hydrolase